MDNNNLHYEISDWKQLTKCLSNNSNELRISVCNYVQNSDIEGTKISVVHPHYGVLFSYTIDPIGKLVTDIDSEDIEVVNTQILLNELKRYGFEVVYKEEEHLPESQVDLLRSIQKLNFDKLRLCVVHDGDVVEKRVCIIAFNIIGNEHWLNAGYSPNKYELHKAILDGSALNVSGLTDVHKYSWDWLYNVIIDLNDLLSKYDEDESE